MDTALLHLPSTLQRLSLVSVDLTFAKFMTFLRRVKGTLRSLALTTSCLEGGDWKTVLQFIRDELSLQRLEKFLGNWGFDPPRGMVRFAWQGRIGFSEVSVNPPGLQPCGDPFLLISTSLDDGLLLDDVVAEKGLTATLTEMIDGYCTETITFF